MFVVPAAGRDEPLGAFIGAIPSFEDGFVPFTWSGSVHPISEECITKNALIGCFMYHFKEASSLMVQ